jgi:hypothetical protein
MIRVCRRRPGCGAGWQNALQTLLFDGANTECSGEDAALRQSTTVQVTTRLMNGEHKSQPAIEEGVM